MLHNSRSKKGQNDICRQVKHINRQVKQGSARHTVCTQVRLFQKKKSVSGSLRKKFILNLCLAVNSCCHLSLIFMSETGKRWSYWLDLAWLPVPDGRVWGFQKFFFNFHAQLYSLHRVQNNNSIQCGAVDKRGQKETFRLVWADRKATFTPITPIM